MAPNGGRRVEGQTLNIREIRPAFEEGIGQAPFGLIHPDNVGTLGVGHAVKGERLRGRLNLDVVEEHAVLGNHADGGAQGVLADGAQILSVDGEQVDGVSQAELVGGADREILVRPDPRKLAIYGIEIEDIEVWR